MAVFSVHLPAGGVAAAADAAFVREGFSPAAFLLGPLWLAGRGFFLATALYLAAAAALIALVVAGALGAGSALATLALIHVLLGLEADRMIERRLHRRGFDLVEIVAAPGLEEAEMAFFRAIAARAPATPRAAGAEPVIGALSGPGGARPAR